MVGGRRVIGFSIKLASEVVFETVAPSALAWIHFAVVRSPTDLLTHAFHRAT